MDAPQNACYQCARILEGINSYLSTTKLQNVLEKTFPAHDAIEARLRILAIFDDAIEEISLIPTLPEEHVTGMLAQVRSIQGNVLMALAAKDVETFMLRTGSHSAISTLNLIGHTLAASNIARHEPFDREVFLKEAEEMLQNTRDAPINDMQKAVLELKLRSIIRIMHECEGASDEQIRRRLKNIFADVQAEFEHIEDEQKEFVEKFADWVSKSMKSGTFALGLTADMLSVLSIAGPVAAAALLAPSPPPLMIEGPDAPHEAAAATPTPE